MTGGGYSNIETRQSDKATISEHHFSARRLATLDTSSARPLVASILRRTDIHKGLAMRLILQEVPTVAKFSILNFQFSIYNACRMCTQRGDECRQHCNHDVNDALQRPLRTVFHVNLLSFLYYFNPKSNKNLTLNLS